MSRKIPDIDTIVDWLGDKIAVTHRWTDGKKGEVFANIVGTERRIRIHPHRNSFQISDENFDRWANSVEFDYPIPLSKKQALSIINGAKNEKI